MKITQIEVVKTKKPIPLPGEYKAAWFEPDGKPATSYGFSYFKVHTDEGITGYGPYAGGPDDYVLQCLIGLDPFFVEHFWDSAMMGREVYINKCSYGGLDAALWDIIGKASKQPVYKLLGANKNKMMVYAATSRLLSPEAHIEQVQKIRAMGFKAVKLRLHRPDYRDDLKVVEAVRKACGDDLTIVVDANQNHKAINYKWWSRTTARFMARELQNLNVYFFEEPLPRRDYEGLAELSKEFDMYIAGGEHSLNIYEFKEHLERKTYDILQPDLTMGDVGITGTKKLAIVSDFYDRIIIPHVSGLGGFALNFAAMLHATASIRNCPMLEYPCDPPFLTVESQQFYLKDKFTVDKDGYVALPDRPGLGIEIDEEAVARYL
ncbi:MAG: mandelate racemase/muconate lactonizing enzyme family protein [Treponema sp.]|nr:mandelate racemase/muconate lactonizing enzyme family protein [Treponema sp.]